MHHPLRDLLERVAELRSELAVGDDRELPGRLGGDDGPTRGRHPGRGALDDEVADFLGVE